MPWACSKQAWCAAPAIAPLLGGIGGFFGGLVFLSIGAVIGQSGFLSLASLKTVAIAAVYDGLIAPSCSPWCGVRCAQPERSNLAGRAVRARPRVARSLRGQAAVGGRDVAITARGDGCPA